jgi:hypothetical protein
MHNESDGFEGVQRLLALKKYEKPPPRYFQDFSDKVIARIQAAEEARLRPWWQKLGLDFVLKPAFAGALGLMLSAGVVAGVVLANPENAAQNGSPHPFAPPIGFEMADSGSQSTMRFDEPAPSTAPVASTIVGATPFSHISLNAQPVNWIVR